THDANGNLTRKQNTTDSADTTVYNWDSNNRLTQIAQPGLTASFSYDAFGRRIQSSITKGGSTSTVQYLYEGLQSLGEIRDGKLSHRLLTGLSLDETIARMAINSSGSKDAATSRVYMTDALNSVIAQLNDEDAANVANSYAYSPYGESQTIGPDATGNPIQYTSRENDGTGLMFYRARYYDAVLGGFISSDPIGLNGGLNEFGYVEGDPVNQLDPLGLWAIGIEGYGGIGGGVSLACKNGKLEIISRLGVGVGGGFGIDPVQGVSPHATGTAGAIGRTFGSLGGEIKSPVGSVGLGGTLRSGNAVTTKVGGGYFEPNYTQFGKGSWNQRLSLLAAFGVEFGGYIDVGMCTCQ
ncbi:RHS repeat-associated core domain-containing protein, partial [Hydrogenophaga sp.]|uniref:RHS repeat-associated core domain-containing protein n=1 Tax=Hydrogenophaga sp. TaxID=1904254 RepID=UPI002ABA83C0